MTTRHRKCGCDCNDQTRWVEDDGITQATFDCGCADGAKPPCVYWANFECAIAYTGDPAEVFPGVRVNSGGAPVRRQYVRGVSSYTEQLRPTCKWGPEGRYVSLRSLPESLAAENGSCTWDDVLQLGNVRLPAMWQDMESAIRWTLSITESPVTLVHSGGATYSQKPEEAWDCFGPNTLWLDKDPLEYPDYSTLPKFVCVTPDVYAVKNEPTSCNQCYGMTLPKIAFYYGEIPQQEIKFLRALIEERSEYVGAFPVLADSTAHLMQAPVLLQTTFGPGTINDVTGGFTGGRTFILMQFLDAITGADPVRATMTFPLNGLGQIDRVFPVVYECNQFRCGETNTFSIIPFAGYASTTTGWPPTLVLEPGGCTRSDQYQWGPCWNSSGSTSWEDGYPQGQTEESRKNCCDPWCSCAPGWLKVFNPSGSYLSQTFGGLTTEPTTFCAGGRYGLNSPSSVSREWCVENVRAADGTTHQVCMVLYCGSLGGGVTWLIDWYCDGTFVATRNMNQVLTCCPNQMAQLGPEMPCLPGAVLCVGINIEPACEPPPPPCCNLSDYQSTLTLTMYTTGCSGWPATVTLTKSGSMFSGSFSVGSNAVLVTFDCVNPVNGVSCGIKFVCSSTGTSRVGQMESTTCSPPTLTGSVGLGLTFFCGCGAISSVACVLNTP